MDDCLSKTGLTPSCHCQTTLIESVSQWHICVLALKQSALTKRQRLCISLYTVHCKQHILSLLKLWKDTKKGHTHVEYICKICYVLPSTLPALLVEILYNNAHHCTSLHVTALHFSSLHDTELHCTALLFSDGQSSWSIT